MDGIFKDNYEEVTRLRLVIHKLKSQNAILREALEFYGNILNYDKDGVIEVLGRTCHSNMVWRDSDKGKVARTALNKIKQTEGD